MGFFIFALRTGEKVGGQGGGGICLQWGWGKEKYRKSGLESGGISGCAGADSGPTGVFPLCRE
jgi:hypothetical protein